MPLSSVGFRSGEGNHSDVVSRMHSSFFMVVYSSIALSGGSVRILGPFELATAHLAVLLLRQELGHLRVEVRKLVPAGRGHHAGARREGPVGGESGSTDMTGVLLVF